VLDHPYCRLTVLSPRRSVDVSLPADVPVAELVPMVLELVGEPGPPVGPWRPEPWRISGVTGGPLPPGATLGQLGVLDGELLRIARAAPPPAAPVFDDPVDALAAGAGTGVDRRAFGAGAVLVAVVGAAAVLAGGGPGSPAAAALAGLGAVAALVVVSRAVRGLPGDSPLLLARVAAPAAVPLAAAAGWAAMPGAAGAALLAFAAAGTVAAVAQLLLRVVAPVLVGSVVVAVLGAVAVLGVRFGLTGPAAAAAVAAVAVVAGPLLPRVAIRLAGLPRPVIPEDGDELADAGPEELPPEELAERADLARGYLAGLAGACAATAAVGAVTAATAGGWMGPAFAAVTVVVLALRARGYADAGPARAAQVAAIGAGLVLAGLAAQHGDALRLVAAAGLLVTVGAGLAGLGRTGPPGSPVSRRAVNILEGLLVAATVPLALGAMDLYAMVRGW
jgi:type VII secretion integral membrane protein EccD